jgi:hypothetical protein
MENELNFQVLVTSNEQISDAYPELFEKHDIDIVPIHIEKKSELIDYVEEPRIILLPSGVISISSKDNQDFIWSDYKTEEYKKLLIELNKKTSMWDRENNHNKLLHTEIINDKDYVINFFPHKDPNASSVLINMLDTKVHNIKSKIDLKR